MAKEKTNRTVRVPLSEEEYTALEKLRDKYYTNKINDVVRNIVRDEIKDFEEKNQHGVFVKYRDGVKEDNVIYINFDDYTGNVIKKYSQKLSVSTTWFVRLLLRPQIESVLQKGMVQ